MQRRECLLRDQAGEVPTATVLRLRLIRMTVEIAGAVSQAPFGEHTEADRGSEAKGIKIAEPEAGQIAGWSHTCNPLVFGR
jgi:hypothetical protein